MTVTAPVNTSYPHACTCHSQNTHDEATAPTTNAPDCTCHKWNGARLVHRHEARCPRHADFHNPQHPDCRRYCRPDREALDREQAKVRAAGMRADAAALLAAADRIDPR